CPAAARPQTLVDWAEPLRHLRRLCRRELDRLGERAAPVGDSLFAKGCQPTDVAFCVRGEHQADRRHIAQRELPAAEDDMDERAPNPAVSVGEGMDGLELCVSDGSLND